MFDTHSLPKDKIEELEKASSITKNKLEFAFLLDHLREEREQGITIDTSQTFFRTKNREYQIIDAPGHVEFVRNMMTGAAQANLSVVIVDAVEGVMQQTNRHLYILSVLNLKNIIIAVNKMDQVGYSQKRFEDVAVQVKNVLKKLNMKADYFIPISALDGDNVCYLSENMNWYKGPHLLEVMESIQPAKERHNLPAIMQVQDVYKNGEKRIAVGRVEAGILQCGNQILVVQTGECTKIKTIAKFPEEINYANTGECIGITIKDKLFLHRGYILCDEKAGISLSMEFEASLIWLHKTYITVGEKLRIRCGTQETTCIIKEILQKINTEKLEEVLEKQNELNYLDAARVTISLKVPLAISKFDRYACIGRFVLLRDDNICAGGIIL